MKKSFVFCLLITLLFIVSCASYGPSTVSRDRFDYNNSIGESWKHQILLNIVKMRYAEPLSFVDVGQIVSSYSIETGANLNAKGSASNWFSSASIDTGLSAKYTDRPTITYSPITGSAFIHSIMTPISLPRLFEALQAELPAQMIFRLSIRTINGLSNQRPAFEGFVPAEERFVKVYELLRELQLLGSINIKISKLKNTSDEEITISFPVFKSDDRVIKKIEELKSILGLDSNALHFRVVPSALPTDSREIAIQTYSIMHIFALLGSYVKVPERDLIEKRASPGIIKESRDEKEREHFIVYSSNTQPEDVFSSVRYRNNWFWIDDKDIVSKRIMSFLVLLMTLADTSKDKTPLMLTIPTQ